MRGNCYGVKVIRFGRIAFPIRQKTASPELCEKYWRKVIENQNWFDCDKECLVALLVNAQLRILSYSLVSIGSLTEAIAHPREIFRAAIAESAWGLILIHNHCSGYAVPSRTDRVFTRRIAACGRLLGIDLIDHLILGDPAAKRARDRRFSFKEEGKIL